MQQLLFLIPRSSLEPLISLDLGITHLHSSRARVLCSVVCSIVFSANQRMPCNSCALRLLFELPRQFPLCLPNFKISAHITHFLNAFVLVRPCISYVSTDVIKHNILKTLSFIEVYLVRERWRWLKLEPAISSDRHRSARNLITCEWGKYAVEQCIQDDGYRVFCTIYIYVFADTMQFILIP